MTSYNVMFDVDVEEGVLLSAVGPPCQPTLLAYNIGQQRQLVCRWLD